MSVSVTCKCGESFDVEAERAGQAVQCPGCGSMATAASAAAEAGPEPEDALADIFDQDRFLLREKSLAFSAEGYDVCDEDGKALLYVERPYHLMRTVLAALAGIPAGLAVAGVCVAAALVVESHLLAVAFGVLAVVAGVFAIIVVAVPLLKKRHITFYRDTRKSERVLDVLQDTKVQFLKADYTIQTPDQQAIARLTRNYVHTVFRRRWDCYSPDGQLLCVAKEDSLRLALLRRLLGPLFWIPTTSFIMQLAQTGDTVGELNRKRTILDRYVLDLTGDRLVKIDRRVAVAIGVMLDLG